MGDPALTERQAPVQRDEPIAVNRGQRGIIRYRGPAKRYLCDQGHLIAVGNFAGWVQPWCHKCDKAVDLFEDRDREL